MKIFLDQGVPWRSAALLREAGLDTPSTPARLASQRLTTRPILVWSREHGRTIVTLDADFHARLALSGATAPSVIRIRQQGLKGPEMARLIETVAAVHRDALESGAMLTVVRGRVRCHTLPVRRPGGAPAD